MRAEGKVQRTALDRDAPDRPFDQVGLLGVRHRPRRAQRRLGRRCLQLERQMGQVGEQSARQYDSVKSVAAATDELSVSVREVAGSAGETSSAAMRAQQLIAAGNGRIGETVLNAKMGGFTDMPAPARV